MNTCNQLLCLRVNIAIQNELLDIMFKTLQCTIQKEVEQADLMAVIADDTTDVSNHLQNASLLQLLIESNLAETFSETVLLLKAISTVPLRSCKAERCFSTLKRVKTFLRNTMSEDRVDALVMLSIEKNLFRDSIDFNQNVIEVFAQLKNRRAKFLFK